MARENRQKVQTAHAVTDCSWQTCGSEPCEWECLSGMCYGTHYGGWGACDPDNTGCHRNCQEYQQCATDCNTTYCSPTDTPCPECCNGITECDYPFDDREKCWGDCDCWEPGISAQTANYILDCANPNACWSVAKLGLNPTCNQMNNGVLDLSCWCDCAGGMDCEFCDRQPMSPGKIGRKINKPVGSNARTNSIAGTNIVAARMPSGFTYFWEPGDGGQSPLTWPGAVDVTPNGGGNASRSQSNHRNPVSMQGYGPTRRAQRGSRASKPLTCCNSSNVCNNNQMCSGPPTCKCMNNPNPPAVRRRGGTTNGRSNMRRGGRTKPRPSGRGRKRHVGGTAWNAVYGEHPAHHMSRRQKMFIQKGGRGAGRKTRPISKNRKGGAFNQNNPQPTNCCQSALRCNPGTECVNCECIKVTAHKSPLKRGGKMQLGGSGGNCPSGFTVVADGTCVRG